MVTYGMTLSCSEAGGGVVDSAGVANVNRENKSWKKEKQRSSVARASLYPPFGE